MKKNNGANVGHGRNLVEHFFGIEKKLTRGKHSDRGLKLNSRCMKDINGRVLNLKNKVSKRWKQYFEGLPVAWHGKKSPRRNQMRV